MALTNQQMEAMGLGLAGAGLGSLFSGGENPSSAAMPYLNQIPGQVSPYLSPYMNAGSAALPQLQQQYNSLLTNPGAKLNDIGSSFQQSPGFQFALQQALQGSNHAAAAGGMAGSPMHEQQNMQLATQLGNQDYYNYLNHATGLYGQGLQGEQGLAGMGLKAGTSLADLISQQLALQAQYAYAGQAAENAADSSGLSSLIGGVASVIPFI